MGTIWSAWIVKSSPRTGTRRLSDRCRGGLHAIPRSRWLCYRLDIIGGVIWKVWIQTKATDIQAMLTQSGTSPDVLAGVDVIQIACAFALDYSAKMEAELSKRMM